MHEYKTGLPENETELERLLELLGPIFHFPRERAPKFREAIGDDNFRVVRSDEDLAGGLTVVHMGQFFGGRSVSTAGIVAVGIAPQYRARGAASALMSDLMRELHREKRCALSTLYPATVPIYRKAGYGLAGVQCDISMQTGMIDMREYGPALRAIESDKDRQAAERLYREFVQRQNGPLDRGDYIWNRIRESRGDKAQGYLVVENGEPTGYIYYLIKDHAPGMPYGDNMHLYVTDMAAVTAPAGRRLLTLLADHRSMEQHVKWTGGPSPVLLAHMREAIARIQLHATWMVRIVDVERAFKERGYASMLDGEVHFEVSDDVIESNNDRFVLSVRNGEAQVRRGGNGDVKLHVRALAALFTSYRTVHELVSLDLAEATEPAAQAANAMFAGPSPWMSDMF